MIFYSFITNQRKTTDNNIEYIGRCCTNLQSFKKFGARWHERAMSENWIFRCIPNSNAIFRCDYGLLGISLRILFEFMQTLQTKCI